MVSNNKRKEIEFTIDDIVDKNFGGSSNLKKLLKETAAHESHFGELSDNIMQVDPGEQKTLQNEQYQPQLAHLGARRNPDGSFKENDLRTNIILGAMRYMRTTKDEIPKSQRERYKIWKKDYNTEYGKGTPESFKESLKKYEMFEPEESKENDDIDWVSRLNPFQEAEAFADEIPKRTLIDTSGILSQTETAIEPTPQPIGGKPRRTLIDNSGILPSDMGLSDEDSFSMQATSERDKFDYAKYGGLVSPDMVAEWRSAGKKGYPEMARETPLHKAIPFVGMGTEATHLAQVKFSVDRLKRDNYKGNTGAKSRDLIRVQKYLLKEAEREARGVTVGGQIYGGIAELPAFLGEFLATGGLSAFGRGAVAGAGKQILRKGVKGVVKKAVLKTALRGTGWVAGGVMRTTGMPHRVAKGVIDRRIKNTLGGEFSVTNKGLEIISEGQEKPFTSVMKAFGDVLIENMSEVAGEGITKIGKKFIPKGLGKAFTNFALKHLPKNKVSKLWTKAGYHGVLEEMGEERLGDFMRGLTGVTGKGNVFERVVQAIPSGEQILVEAGIFSIPGAMQAISVKASEVRDRRRKGEFYKKVVPEMATEEELKEAPPPDDTEALEKWLEEREIFQRPMPEFEVPLHPAEEGKVRAKELEEPKVEAEPLVEEAKKHKTAEEFVESVPIKSRSEKRKIIKDWKEKTEYKTKDYSFSRGEPDESIHEPADPESGSPLYNLTENETYPEDVYSYEGLRYYGTGEDVMDRKAYSIISNVEGLPNKIVTIYRAVEKDGKSIQPGDWVTTVRQYAKEHGESTLKGEYKIVSKTVTAKDLFTSGDSWLEYGYHPQSAIPRKVYVKDIKTLKDIWQKAQVPKVEKPALKIEPKEKVTKVSRGQLPVGEGKQKVSRLVSRLTESLEGISEKERENIPQYKQMSKKDQIQKASEYVTVNPKDALSVLKGEKEAPKGILYNSIYIALSEHATDINDTSLIMDIASLRATRAGQEISMLTEAGKESPVRYIADFVKRKIQSFGGEQALKKRKVGETARLKSVLRKAKPSRGDWISFVDSIRC